MALTTHQIIRMAGWVDSIEAKQRVRRRCAVKAADMGNRGAALYWSSWCMKADGVVSKLRRRLNEEN